MLQKLHFTFKFKSEEEMQWNAINNIINTTELSILSGFIPLHWDVKHRIRIVTSLVCYGRALWWAFTAKIKLPCVTQFSNKHGTKLMAQHESEILKHCGMSRPSTKQYNTLASKLLKCIGYSCGAKTKGWSQSSSTLCNRLPLK